MSCVTSVTLLCQLMVLSPISVIAVRMDRMLSRELTLEIQDSVFWTDSMIVLQYIYSRSKRFQTFVLGEETSGNHQAYGKSVGCHSRWVNTEPVEEGWH